MQDVLLDLARDFYLILLSFLWTNTRHDAWGPSVQQLASSISPMALLLSDLSEKLGFWLPFLHNNCKEWESREAWLRGQQPQGRQHGCLSSVHPSDLTGGSAFPGYSLSDKTRWRANLEGRPSPSCAILLSSDWVSVIRWWEPHSRACPSFSQRWNIIKYHLHPEKLPFLKSLMPVTHALCLTCSVKWEVSSRAQSF